MPTARPTASPARSSYDVVIVGGAIMGSAAAWFLADNPDFDGSVLVVEMDPSYASCSTAHTNSCIRQQFSTDLNIRISQFTAAFIKDLPARMGDDPRVPRLPIRSFGYMYLADNDNFAATLRRNRQVQQAAGVPTELLTPDEIAARYPFYNLDDILLGSINLKDEGYWDGAALFDCFRRQARERGVEYVTAEVVGMGLGPDRDRVLYLTLDSGETIACGHVVNATGPRAARTARMAGIDIPVEPRKRYTWVFRAEKPLDRDLPLTIDPTGIHVREHGGGTYMCGGHGADDRGVDFDDFAMDHGLWEAHVWPILAHRIPAFAAIRVQSEWAGHYAMNLLDRNAIVGPHEEVSNFIFMNGFSGHGLQQAPAMGRGVAEWVTYRSYRSLDLTPFGYARVIRGPGPVESAVI